ARQAPREARQLGVAARGGTPPGRGRQRYRHRDSVRIVSGPHGARRATPYTDGERGTVRFLSLARLAFVAALAALVVPAGALADRGGHNDRASFPDKKALFDSRPTPAAEKVLDARDRDMAATPDPDVASLKDSLGAEGIVDRDALTHTLRFLGRLDGFLTGPSRRDPADIALDYLKKNSKAFGVD